MDWARASANLAEFDERGGGVCGEVVLCPGGEGQGLGFERCEEGEIGRSWFGHEHGNV